MQLSAAISSGLEKQVKKTNQQPGDSRSKKCKQKKPTKPQKQSVKTE